MTYEQYAKTKAQGLKETYDSIPDWLKNNPDEVKKQTVSSSLSNATEEKNKRKN